ncbi:MAG: PD40 domain-containing protein, partial [Chloroflexi bacterium]|nr:PD40 domain-containing protein [Chloroflexota bacterium]
GTPSQPPEDEENNEIVVSIKCADCLFQIRSCPVNGKLGLTEPYLGFGMSPDGQKQITRIVVDVKAGGSEIYVTEIGGTRKTLIAKFDSTGGWFGGGSWFPNSNRIAFEQWSAPPGGSDGIYVLNEDGSGLAKLGVGSAPVVSPDGSKIAFVHGGDIWTMNSDGNNRIQLTNISASEYRPAWSPDGKRIVFVVSRSGIFSNPL